MHNGYVQEYVNEYVYVCAYECIYICVYEESETDSQRKRNVDLLSLTKHIYVCVCTGSTNTNQVFIAKCASHHIMHTFARFPVDATP